jgi:hypothetical protein
MYSLAYCTFHHVTKSAKCQLTIVQWFMYLTLSSNITLYNSVVDYSRSSGEREKKLNAGAVIIREDTMPSITF